MEKRENIQKQEDGITLRMTLMRDDGTVYEAERTLTLPNLPDDPEEAMKITAPNQ